MTLAASSTPSAGAPRRTGRSRSWAARARDVAPPVILAAGALSAIGLAQAVFDPFTQHVPLCAVQALTGLECPGCGMTRAVHALLAGDPLLALRCNLLLVVLIPVVLVLWGRWLVRRWRGDARSPEERLAALPGPRLLLAVGIPVLVFTVLRNLPALWFLAPPAA